MLVSPAPGRATEPAAEPAGLPAAYHSLQSSGVASPVYSFTTAPAPGADDTLTILLAADTGTGEDEDNALRPTAHKSVGAYAVYKVGW